MESPDPKHSKRNLLIACAIIIVGAAVFAILLHKKPAPKNAAPGAETAPVSTLDWSKQIPEITTALDSAFPSNLVASRSDVTIVSQADVTGDGVPEALVDLGIGGASFDFIALVQMVDGKIQVAKFKEQDGTVDYLLLPQGSASLHSDAVGLSTDLHAVYHGNVEYGSDGTLSSCTSDVYVWNGTTNLFEYNATASSGLQQTFCSDIAPNADSN